MKALLPERVARADRGSLPRLVAVAVVTDTCHYLPAEVIAGNEISQVSLYVHWKDEVMRESEISDYGAYFKRLGSATELPTTSQPSIGDFLAVYEPLLAGGNDIVSVHLSAGLSGTVHAAEQARDQLGVAPERVQIVDSSTACGGEGLIVLAAAAAARNGAGAPAVAEHARRARAELRMWFSIDTLDYLRKGGRIGGAQAWVGSALRIKPILTVESEITPFERVRTSGRAFERMVELLQERKDAGADAYMVQHIQAPEVAAKLSERALEIFGKPGVVTSEIGPVIGSHVGPGLLGVGGIPSSYLA
jgi:DegV family protein with EDD domain